MIYYRLIDRKVDKKGKTKKKAIWIYRYIKLLERQKNKYKDKQTDIKINRQRYR